MTNTLKTSDTPLDADIPCMRCGYNLRTKRPSELCPECGLGVRFSITCHAEHRDVVPQPRMAVLGFLLMAAGFAQMSVMMLPLRFQPFGNAVAWMIAGAAASDLALASGMITVLLAQRRSPTVGPWLRRIGFVLAGAFAIAVLLWVGTAVWTIFLPRSGPGSVRVSNVIFDLYFIALAATLAFWTIYLWQFATALGSWPMRILSAVLVGAAALLVGTIGGFRLAWAGAFPDEFFDANRVVTMLLIAHFLYCAYIVGTFHRRKHAMQMVA